MKLRLQKLDQSAHLPHKQHDSDACFDLHAVSVKSIEGPSPDCFEYGTGLALEIPTGHVGLIFPRSSVSKTSGWMANSVGVVDAGYRGEIRVRFRADTAPYKAGDRVAQLMILPLPAIEFEEVESLTDSSRGEGGFGSTGT